MYFGNYGTTIGNTKGGTDETSYVGGKWNTHQCVSKTNQGNISGKVDNNPGKGYCAPACCCVAYSTPGTKTGDWYLPMPGELYQFYVNPIIDEKRTAIKGSGFYGGHYWSSRESHAYSEYIVSDNISGGNKDNSICVIAFLAVEVSQLVN